MAVTTTDQSDFPTSYEQYADENTEWPYEVTPLDPAEHENAITWLGLHEFAFLGEDGEIYAGCYPRAMINNAANTDQPLMIGASDRGNQSVGILHKERYRHIFCGGQTGAGKTVAAKNSVQQDALAGNGFCFIDPGGEDIIDIVRSLPEDRLGDLIYMEPGNEYRSHSIGLNYLDTLHEPGQPGYKKECESITTNLLPMLNADEFARMKGVASNMLRYLIKADYEDSDYEYTLIDLYYMLGSEDARQAYADNVQQDKLEFLKPYAEKIRTLADDKLEPLIRRLQNWVENDVIRPFIAQRNSDFSIADAVSNQRIVLVKANLGQNEREMITAALTTKLWSAITSRPNEDERRMMEYEGIDVPDLGADDGGHKSFFLVADEFHAVASENTDIGEMLAMARKKGLGLYLLTQQLSQLSTEQQEQILGNCSTLLAFDPGRHPKERKALAGGFDGIEASDLGIGRYKFWTTLTDEQGDESQAFLTHSTPPYPPIRTVEEANEALNYAQRTHGSERLSDQDILDQIPDEFSATAAHDALGSTGDDGELDAVIGNDIAERKIIKAIYDAGIRNGDSATAEPIPSKHAHDAVATDIDLSMTQLSDLIEEMAVMDLLRTRLSDGDTLVSVTPDGLDRLGLNSGSGGSAGGSVHRELLRRMYIELVRLGYDADIPTQSGDEIADAVGELPSEIDLSNMGLSEANQYLHEEYPAITELSGDGKLIVEAESRGLSKPAGPIKNYAKADTDRHQLLFAVAEAGADGTDNARQLANIFTNNQFTNNRPPADVARKFYTKNRCPADPIESTDADPTTQYAIHPDPDASTQWVEHTDGSVVCRTDGGETVARFADYEAFSERSSDASPGVRYYDDDNDVHVAEWIDADGNDQRIKRPSKSKLRDEITVLQYPRIPELVFDGDVPTPDNVAEEIEIVIVPDEPEAEDAPVPQLSVYDIETSETTPLGEYLDTDMAGRPAMDVVSGSDTAPNDTVRDGSDDDSEKTGERSIEERMKDLGFVDAED